ncbi:N-acetylmuramoyl-L-alanine amidase [Mycobacterium sp.]|uniref:N-acetylmuramoyl-L-alanine amidase n=1 Tax=Mycobacterium sp. TaxID=1785 RepID=UPI002C8882A1|nr:N-acetylmuramoyl-L-alanine amidase [Mycobacterium sp.]HME47063.1 N-acetylmuramoyl-L-alanine amidase [Mycobacterium sp.]
MPCRRPAPSILFTAVAATVVLLPWAVDGIPRGDDKRPAATAQAELSEQPLTGVGAGVTIREVSKATPFSMVALTAADLTGTTAQVRAKRADGSWGPWYKAEAVESDGPSEGDRGPRGTEPVFVGRTTDVQIAITRPGAPSGPPPPTTAPKAGAPSLGYVPANVEAPFGQNLNAVLITPPQAPADTTWSPPTAVAAPGQPPNIISRAQWGADESMRCGNTVYDNGVGAAIVHHTAGSNDYSPEDSAEIIRAIYAYHTRTLGWCDIAYNALVDKYGQVFEGHFGGITRAVQGSHTGGFNKNTFGVAMIGDFETVPPTEPLIRSVGRLLGWRLAMDGVDPKGTVQLTSEGGPFTFFPAGARPTLPTIFAHRDTGNTDCPGNAGYAALPEIREIAAKFNQPVGPKDLADSLRGGAIYDRWQATGGPTGPLGAPTTPETSGDGSTRYVRFNHGAIYWSPETGAAPVTGAIYDAWAGQGFERGPLGLPTSGEIQEPEWIVQNFAHGTLNFDRETSNVMRVIDGVALELPPPSPDGPPAQLERFSALVKP